MAGARRYFERARELGPNYAYVYMNLSVLEAHEGRLPEALRAAEQAVRLRPDLDRSHVYLGRVLEKMGRIGEAAAAYPRATELNPRDAEAQGALARLERSGGITKESLMRAGLAALYTQRNPNAAAVQFRKLLEHNPTHYGATFQLAMALDRAGRPAEARPLWEKALKVAEENSDKATADTARAAGEARRGDRGGGAGIDDERGARRPLQAGGSDGGRRSVPQAAGAEPHALRRDLPARDGARSRGQGGRGPPAMGEGSQDGRGVQ